MSSTVYIDNKNRDSLFLDEITTQGLDDTALTAVVKYPFTFIQSERRFLLSLHYNGSSSFLFVNSKQKTLK